MAFVPEYNYPVSDPEVQTRLRAIFAAEDARLRAGLDKARAGFDHAGNKGSAVETAMRSFLRHHLPRKYDVGHGEVIDKFGARSGQLDVIVLNEDQPFTYGEDEEGMYLAEGVSAIGEVKSVMGRKELADILARGERLRKLRPTRQDHELIWSNPSDEQRFVDSYPYFAVALESTMSVTDIGMALQADVAVDSPNPDVSRKLPRLDALFVLNRGTFIHHGDGTGSIRIHMPDGRSIPGWVPNTDTPVLVQLFTWLNDSMPRRMRGASIASNYLFPVNFTPPA